MSKVSSRINACQFFKVIEDLIDTLMPCLKAELGNSELSMWAV